MTATPHCRRALAESEILTLESRGCTADDWRNITVAPDFNPASCRNVRFSGKIELGAFSGSVVQAGGFAVGTGLFDVALHNVSVGDDAYIHNVANYIANYDIENGAFIENVDRIVATGDSSFGVGTEVSVLNETGGREVPMYPRLTAQTAYLMAIYRHNPELSRRMREMIADEAARATTPRGRIGTRARVVNTGAVTNVNIGAYAVVDGAAKLMEGTIAASESDPVFVGTNVMADGFMLAAGAHVDDGVVLHHVFVGQATHLTHLFSAHDSLFFSNCACENGEAAAIFAGPYTVTMHKSSLLIAGLFSFLNAGSGSNQSNHMYKLGPIHQGVVERGSKTTSDSYILWPARIGAFSLVMGRHVGHPDTAKLPFSYLIESHGASYLVPGVNIKSVGTIRDAQKWPKRDKRREPDRLDLINFNLLSPYTASKMFDGIELLDSIEATAGRTSEQYMYRSMTITSSALRKGREYYRLALDKFMGNSVISRLRGDRFASAEDMSERLRPTNPRGEGDWVDISGMIVPKNEIERLCEDIAEGRVDNLQDVEARLRELNAEYYDMEWTWVSSRFRNWYGKETSELTPADIAAIVARWSESVITLDRMLYEDARKEYSLVSRIGFGPDGPRECRDADFGQVRGDFDSDPFVLMVLDHIKNRNALGEELLSRLSEISEN